MCSVFLLRPKFSAATRRLAGICAATCLAVYKCRVGLKGIRLLGKALR